MVRGRALLCCSATACRLGASEIFIEPIHARVLMPVSEVLGHLMNSMAFDEGIG